MRSCCVGREASKSKEVVDFDFCEKLYVLKRQLALFLAHSDLSEQKYKAPFRNRCLSDLSQHYPPITESNARVLHNCCKVLQSHGDT